MNDKATTLREAEDWFLSHASGSLLCEKNGATEYCDSYPQARRFFNTEQPSAASDLLPTFIAIAEAETLSAEISVPDFTPDPTPDPSPGFDAGGGDFGGGGATSDY